MEIESQGSNRTLARCLIITVLGILPFLVVWLLMVAVFPRPFWAASYDPETAYFWGGLRLLSGHTPYNLDSPGLPLHALSAIISGTMGADPLALARFRTVGFAAVLLITCAAWALFCRIGLRDVPLYLAPLAFWLYLTGPDVFGWAFMWSPETLFPALGLVAAAAAWAHYSAPGRWRALWFGVSIGVCIALKFTFLVWLVAAVLVALIDWRGKRTDSLWIIAGAAISFVITTLPVIARYPSMARWLVAIFTHEQAYGRGPVSVPSFHLLVSNLLEMTISVKSWLLCLTACFLMATTMALGQKERHRERSILAFFGTVLVLMIAACIRHPSPRYLLPAAAASVLLVPLMGAGKPRRLIAGLLIFLVGLVVVKSAIFEVSRHRKVIATSVELRALIDGQLQAAGRRADSIVVFGWKVPEPSFALRINAFDPVFLDRIETAYPSEGHYDPWARVIHLPRGAHDWNFLVLNPDDVAHFPRPLPQPSARAGEYLIFENEKQRSGLNARQRP